MALAFRRAVRCGARCAWPVLPSAPGCNAAVRRPWLGADAGARGFAAVPASLVKELRERTGASMGKCRQALAEEDGNIEASVDWLRKRGMRSMEKRTNETEECLLAICTNGTSSGAVVELRAETDFVTQNVLFQQLAISVACTAAARARGSEAASLAET